MKTVLILVLSSDWPPYDRLMQCSMRTWDSIEVDGCETVYYHSSSDNKNTEKVIYFPIDNSLFSVGKKTLMAFEWALKNKSFDYIARPGANCYIHKRGLLNYIQTLPDTDVFTGLEVVDSPRWLWGLGTVISKDVVQKIVDNKEQVDHTKMEDVSISQLVDRLGIPFTGAIACSIDKLPDKWRCTCYGTESFEFDSFVEVTEDKGQFFFRCKQDHDRTQDEFVMNELFKHLPQ